MMRTRRSAPTHSPDNGELFEDSPGGVAAAELTFAPNGRVLWTHTKAKLIEAYIRLFLQITKHGVYIDAMAGQQWDGHDDEWAAKLVANISPDYLNKLFLSDLDLSKVEALREMVSSVLPQKSGKRRRTKYDIQQGDFNLLVDDILASGAIKQSTATFCLIDQHTHECHWRTLEKLARHKDGDHKIEIFYFLATGWLPRVIATLKDTSVLDRWWGNNGWQSVAGYGNSQLSQTVVQRFKTELGYKHVFEFPILKEGNEGREMFRMIHASDHERAPKLMESAYKIASGISTVSVEQLELGL